MLQEIDEARRRGSGWRTDIAAAWMKGAGIGDIHQSSSAFPAHASYRRESLEASAHPRCLSVYVQR